MNFEKIPLTILGPSLIFFKNGELFLAKKKKKQVT